MEAEVCTFTYTQEQYVFQTIYRCRTCQLIGNLGVCYICVRKCHQGHDTFYDYTGGFFCDCGEKGDSFCHALSVSSPTTNTENIVTSTANLETNNSNTSKMFECPVCMSYMSREIHMCVRGHNVCGSCNAKLTVCPICRGNFAGARNLGMESLSRALNVPCEDCAAIVTVSDLNEHKRICLMSSYKCPLKSQCSWIGKIWDTYDHCQQKHRDKVLNGPRHTFEHVNFTSNDESEINIINTSGSLFLFHRYFNQRERVFQGAVKYITPPDKYSFTYTLIFVTDNGEESVKIKKKVRTWSEDVDEIYNLRNSVALHLSQATNIVRVNSLKYTLKIEAFDENSIIDKVRQLLN